MAPASSRDPEAHVTSKKNPKHIQPSQPSVMTSMPPPQKDYLCLSIIALFFFIVLAIPALLFSIKTRDANALGDHRRAKRNSRLALGFGVLSIVLGILLMIGTTVFEIKKHKV